MTVAESNRDKSASEEVVKDLDETQVSEQEQSSIVGGRKAGGTQQDYLIVKMEDVIISSV
jgi:hypothetical protein